MSNSLTIATRFLLLTAALISAGGAVAGEGATRPNIVLVFVDDAGYADFPYFRNDRQRTPNIDALCDEGLRFTQFYVNAPICSPSRVAIMTGQYPVRWGITSYIASRQENARRGIRDWLDPAAPTLARLLQASGYATGHFGKWHLGGGRDVGDAPLISEYGFDRSLTQFEGLGDRILPLMNDFNGKPPEKFPLGVASEQLGQGEVTWVDRMDETGIFVNRAIKFMRQAEAEGKPFFVNLWPDDVHTPLHPPKELRGDGGKRERYLGVLENMDRQLGELFDFVRNDKTLRESTIVIVTSDNGHEPGAGSAGDLKGSKGVLYEGGIREPLVVWGPGVLSKTSAGSVDEQTVISSVDLVPSLLKVAGVEPPTSVKFDGEDLSPSLLGVEKKVRSEPLFWVRPPDRPSLAGDDMPDLAIRDGQWKLLMEFDGANAQLYDVAADPYENVNLARKRPQIARRLQTRLLKWRQSVDAGPKPDKPVRQFANPLYEGADPWVIQHDGKYFTCLSDGNEAIGIHESADLTRLGPKCIVWKALHTGPASRQVWAPELHRLDGRWYVYFAASDGENRNHRTFVLESQGDDPRGPYTLHGPMYTGDDPQMRSNNRWSIDATVLEHGGQRYMVWSGWEEDDDEQWLYIAKMKSPVELAGPRVKLCHNADYLWERVGEDAAERGLNEAPQVLKHDGRTFVVYSASGSWQPTYKLGLLELRKDGDPLNPENWRKAPQPAFTGTAQTYGVGHASFVQSPAGKEAWIVYHAKRDREDGWRRAVFAQRFAWAADGRPAFGRPVSAGDLLVLPHGTPARTPDKAAKTVARFESLDDWSYFGHHQRWKIHDGRLHLGVQPRTPVNDYRTGEKVILNDGQWSNVSVEATVKVVDGERDAGILFRVRRPSVGYDAQEGYFAGIIPNTQRVILGATDGVHWRHIADAAADIEVGKEYELRVVARGATIVVSLDGQQALRADDREYKHGGVGLRVVDTEAAFCRFEVKPLPLTVQKVSSR